MASRLVRDASGGFSFLSAAPEPSETKMHPNPG